MALSACLLQIDSTNTFRLPFFIALFEASANAGIVTLLGNWYQPSERGNRAYIFLKCNPNVFWLPASCALYSGMNEKEGCLTRKWLLNFDGTVGIPIAFYGWRVLSILQEWCEGFSITWIDEAFTFT
ncbi:hypothetical protein BKA64DRAFT_671289 [Cadophora sp. MPI-SDFR-AT-0126]|nr:hypothetical protein BKA64DRAFT_671289 [Leotiomycetes sp. MPI-SDFR-AT-0126]